MKQILLIALFVGFSYALNGQVSQPTTLTELFNKSTTYPGLQAKSAEIEAAGYGVQIIRRQNLAEIPKEFVKGYSSIKLSASKSLHDLKPLIQKQCRI